jgi:hypothetical protein
MRALEQGTIPNGREPYALGIMSPDFYRKEAERLRRLADNQTDPSLAQKLRQMAAEHNALALELDARADDTRTL